MADTPVQSGSETYEHEVRTAGPQMPIPPRAVNLPPSLIDLSAHYNTALSDEVHGKPGNTLATLPSGVNAFGDVLFDVRGLIQLAGSHSLSTTHLIFPEAVTDIAVGCAGAHLHALHASAWSTAVGTEIGAYVLHYVDGHTVRIPLRYGSNVVDWWYSPTNPLPSNAEIAWVGGNPRTQMMGLGLRLCHYTWQNPTPDIPIATLDFVSTLADAAPMLLAITLE
jgi:hypothetical protein